MCISMRFSIGAISGYMRPILRKEAGSHRLRMAAKRLQSVEKDVARPRICHGWIQVTGANAAG
jgi:hypothetical protein